MSKRQWRLGLALAVLVVISSLGLVILLALGVADPPRAERLVWQGTGISDWPASAGNRYIAPMRLTRPGTIEVTAINNSEGIWGIWVDTGWQALIANEGYLAVVAWSEFLHVRPWAANKLYLNIEENGNATLRVNDEIAWTGRIVTSGGEWGVYMDEAANISWQNISLYT